MSEQIEALTSVYTYTNNIKDSVINLISYIDTDNYEKAIELINPICEGIDWIINIIRLTDSLHKGNINFIELNNRLLELVEALENEDYILLRDLFEYEVFITLEDIQMKIEKILGWN